MDFVREPDSGYTPAEAARIWYGDLCHAIDTAIDEAARDAEAFLAEAPDAQFERFAAAVLGEPADETADPAPANSS